MKVTTADKFVNQALAIWRSSFRSFFLPFP